MENVITTINYSQNNITVNINLTEKKFMDDVTNVDFIRYLKGIFTNKSRFISRFITPIKNIKVDFQKDIDNGLYTEFDSPNALDFDADEFLDEIIKIYDSVTPFTYLEAFKLENQQFQALVFGSIDIVTMIKELGNKRIKTEGISLNLKQFTKDGEFIGYKETNNIYETHEINGKKLNLNTPLYAIKCWCTSTDKEHWLWIEDQFKDTPLAAIASTFRIHQNLIPHIKEIKRQGDILLVEMDE